MKYFCSITLFFIAITATVQAQTTAAPAALKAMVKKIASLKSISYQYHREISNPKDNYFSELTGNCYMEFDQADQRSVSRFRMESNDYISVYNGTELFGLNKAAKTYSLTEQPQPRSFGNQSFFFNSIQTLRSVIQQLAASDTIPRHERDTVIQNKAYKVVQIDLHRSSLQYLGSTMHFTKDVTIYYDMVIDPVTSLPYQVLEHNNIDKENYLAKTVFTHINLHPREFDTYSWYYSTYQKDYQPEKKIATEPLIAKGSLLLPDWSLPGFGEDKDELFDGGSLKGKLVLLDFWIRNCGPCMESFPVLQQLQQKYGGENFQLISINAYDKKEDVQFFYKREKPLYKMLYEGAKVAKKLGVSYYPTAVLLDKNGKVIYAGVFDHAVVERLIKENL